MSRLRLALPSLASALCLALGLALVWGLLPSPARSAPVATPPVRGLEMQIDMAGRQRMLSQRMTAAACLFNLGVNPDQQKLALRESIELFDAGLSRLENGYPLIGMPAVADPLGRARLTAERSIWSEMVPLVTAIRDYGRSPETMHRITGLEPLLLRASQSLVQSLRRDTLDVPEKKALLKAIDVAGRQRMLAYAMLKQACLITTEARSGNDTESYRQALEEALDLFEMSAGQLVAGDEEALIAPPPNDEAFTALDAVQFRWQDMRPMLEPALEGEALGPALLGDLAYDYDALLRDLEDVVWYYTLE